MLLTLSLSGWHKDVVKQFRMPTPRWVSKGPRSFQLRGPFALPGLSHCALLLFEECCEGMGDRDAARGKAPSCNSIIYLLIDLLSQPYVRLPKAPFLAGLTETLDALAGQGVWHLTPI